jgi:hypothetical protein
MTCLPRQVVELLEDSDHEGVPDIESEAMMRTR